MGQEEITASSLRRVVWLARGAGTSGYLMNNRGGLVFSIHSTGHRWESAFSSSRFASPRGKIGKERVSGRNHAKPWEEGVLSVWAGINCGIFLWQASFIWLEYCRGKRCFFSLSTNTYNE